MAQGEVKIQNNCKKTIVVAEGVYEANGVPSTDEDGVPMFDTTAFGLQHPDYEDGASLSRTAASQTRLVLKGDSGVSSVTGTLWGWLDHAQAWIPNKINGAAAMTSFKGYSEVYPFLSAFDRIYFEMTAITGGEAPVAASVTPGTTSLDSVFEAREAGEEGNDIQFTLVGDSGPSDGVVIEEDVSGRSVIVHYEDAVSTVLDVETAIDSDSTLIVTKTPGTAAAVLAVADDDEMSDVLAGGEAAVGVTAYLVTPSESF